MSIDKLPVEICAIISDQLNESAKRNISILPKFRFIKLYGEFNFGYYLSEVKNKYYYDQIVSLNISYMDLFEKKLGFLYLQDLLDNQLWKNDYYNLYYPRTQKISLPKFCHVLKFECIEQYFAEIMKIISVVVNLNNVIDKHNQITDLRIHDLLPYSTYRNEYCEYSSSKFRICGFNQFINLVKLEINTNIVNDINEILNITNLEELHLYGLNHINNLDFSRLSKLTILTVNPRNTEKPININICGNLFTCLELKNCNIFDFTQFVNLRKLIVHYYDFQRNWQINIQGLSLDYCWFYLSAKIEVLRESLRNNSLGNSQINLQRDLQGNSALPANWHLSGYNTTIFPREWLLIDDRYSININADVGFYGIKNYNINAVIS